jgi:hypothetical protein
MTAMKVLPKRLLIEVTNFCNADCDYCMRSMMRRKLLHLPIEDYKRWCRNVPAYTDWVQPQGIGEPLMYPDIAEAISYPKTLGKKVMFYTNASLLTQDRAELILDAGLDFLTFSVDGFDEQTFQSRKGLRWKPVLQNIMRFQKLRDQRGYTCKTQIRGTITDLNKWKIFQYYWFWTGKVDVVTMMPFVQFPTPQELDRKPWNSGTGFMCYHLFPVKMPLTPAVAILNNGDVVVCCQDWHSDYVMSNLYADPWKHDPVAAFNSEKYEELRIGMQSGAKYPNLCEYCRLGKINKSHRRNPFRFYAKVSMRIANRLKASSQAAAINE